FINIRITLSPRNFERCIYLLKHLGHLVENIALNLLTKVLF
ncbi:MAG: hypothetical protein RLZZ262_1126, partial [Bacteroidota bacterium]